MRHKECWCKYENGYYGYKNGIFVKREGKEWIVFTLYEDKRNILYASDTLAACKNWLAKRYL